MSGEKKNTLENIRFHQKMDCKAYEYLGAHLCGKNGAAFRVWAPNAKSVSVVGEFNEWSESANPMEKITEDGIYEGFISALNLPQAYGFSILTADGEKLLRTDPFAIYIGAEKTSVLCDLEGYRWKDTRWMNARKTKEYKALPMNIYEVYPKSFCGDASEGFPHEKLVSYVKEMGYTHIELISVMESASNSSAISYFAPMNGYGTPQELMQLVDLCHQNQIGVILDWNPASFPADTELYRFDGGSCYENPNGSGEQDIAAFDYSRPEVQSFLASSAFFWLEKYHIDGLKFSGIDMALYLDDSDEDGAWRHDSFGRRENREGISFLRRMNRRISERFPGVLLIAEESGTRTGLTKPSDEDYLGFTFKWNTGWVNDILGYLALEPEYRGYNHDRLTTGFFYAFSENFILAVSRGEVANGKNTLINKMPGEYQMKFAGVRAFLGYMMAHPGKKLSFMGQEFGQFSEWELGRQLDWKLLDYEMHQKLQAYVKELGEIYKKEKPLWEIDDNREGFIWISHDDYQNNTIAFRRIDQSEKELIILCNFSPSALEDYKIGVPNPGRYKELLNSDLVRFGGTGAVNDSSLHTEKEQLHGYDYTLTLRVPPMSVIYLKADRRGGKVKPSGE